MAINYEINQALIRLRADMIKLEEAMSKLSQQEYWVLAHKYPFSRGITEATRGILQWTDEHIKEDDDEDDDGEGIM